MKFTFSLIALLFSFTVHAALCSRVQTFVDGNVLTASQLNTEFSNAVNCVNSISDANVVSSANILPQKLDPTLAGDGIGRNGSGVLSVNVDGAWFTISGDTVTVSANRPALSIIGNATNAVATQTDIAATPAPSPTATPMPHGGSGGLILHRTLDNILAWGLAQTEDIADGAVTPAKKSAVGQQLSTSSGAYTLSPAQTYRNITNLSVTITTNGRPVFIGLIPDGNVSGFQAILGAFSSNYNAACQFRILRDATTEVGSYFLSASYANSGTPPMSIGVPASSVFTYDFVAAGTYTYTVQSQSGSTTTCSTSFVKELAFEL